MSDRPNLHVGDSGIPLILVVKNRSSKRARDISAAVNMTMLIKKPDDTTFQVAAELYTTGDDGMMSWVITDDTIDQAGEWQVQGFLDDGDATLHTDIETFTVGENLSLAGS